jgi:hypothetical protein
MKLHYLEIFEKFDNRDATCAIQILGTPQSLIG